MKFIDIVTNVINDIDITIEDEEVDKIKNFINRGYNELAKRERTGEVTDLVNNTDILKTQSCNSEFIVAFAKYLYYQYDGQENRAEDFKRDYESYYVKKRIKATGIVVGD